jgi:hypothetical protein
MTYDSEKLVLEKIPSFTAFARLIRPIYARPEIRERGSPLLPGYKLVEIYDAATETCLGSWEEEWFDFAGAADAVIDKLDEFFRRKVKTYPKNISR